MTAIKLLYLAADIVQFAIGGYVIWYGFGLMNRRYDRTSLDYRAGQILLAVGVAIALMVRMR